MATIQTLKEWLPTSESFLAIDLERLGGYLLEILNSNKELRFGQRIMAKQISEQYGLPNSAVRGRRVMEAWQWLEHEGLIAPEPYEDNKFTHFVTSRGQKISSQGDLDAVAQASLLPKKLLHPIISTKIWTNFINQDYETAVFLAFKEVEIAVRRVSNAQQTDLGVSLMRKAFHPDHGALADQATVPAERQAVADLFAGAIGSMKNPSSHRSVPLTVNQAIEMIVLASHLLGIVDSRST